MSLVFATTFFFFFFLIGGGGVLRHSAVQTDFEFEISGPLVRRPSVVRLSFTMLKNLLSETAGPIKAKYYVEPPWVGGTKVCSQHLGLLTKMAAMPIYGKNP